MLPEEKLRILLDNWRTKETGEIARMLEADEASVNRWAITLRRSMMKQGMSNEKINEWLPTKRVARRNAYDIVVSRLLAENRSGGREAGSQKGLMNRSSRLDSSHWRTGDLWFARGSLRLLRSRRVEKTIQKIRGSRNRNE